MAGPENASMLDQVEEEKQSTGEHSSATDSAANTALPTNTATNSLTNTLLDAHNQMRELTNLELIKKAEEYVDNLKLEKAVSLLDEGTRRFPNDTLIMDQYTDLLIQLGEQEKAKQLIERSI